MANMNQHLMKAQCSFLRVIIPGWLSAVWRHYTLTTQATNHQSTWHNISEDSSLLVGTTGVDEVLKSVPHLPPMSII
jgi:hypothetical protein